jgi:hypothetical protein
MPSYFYAENAKASIRTVESNPFYETGERLSVIILWG